MKLSKSEITLIFLVIIGLIIRLYNIGFQHTNYDEDFTLNFARPELSMIELFITALTFDFTPPLYYMFAHISMLIFGATATAIRIPAAIFGTLSIPVMYYIGKEYKDELFGLLIAGFTTIFYNAFFYSRYGRAYAAELFFFSLAFYFFMRLIKGDKHSYIYFAIFSLCSIWTHLYCAVPLGIMMLYVLYKKIDYKSITIITIGSLPLLNYVNLLLTTRTVIEKICDFGATPMEILFVTPLDIFAYSAFIIFPIIVWSLWKHRNEEIIRVITLMFISTWVSMFIFSFKTPIILHYSIFLVPMLLIAFILPFYEAIINNKVYFHHLLIIMVILILEFVQIFALNTIQRGSGW